MRSTEPKISWFGAFVSLVKAFIGIGCLSSAFAFRHMGYAMGSGLVILVIFLATYCIYLLFDAIDQYKPQRLETYMDVGNASFGRTGSIVVGALLVFVQLGVITAYLIFIGGAMSAVLPQFSSTHWILLVLPVVFVLSWIRHYKDIAFFTGFALLMYFIALGLCIWYFASQLIEYGMSETVQLFDSRFFVGMGPIVLAMEGIPLVVPIRQCSKSTRGFNRVFVVCLIVVTLSLFSFGLLGYFAFGKGTRSIVFQNLPNSIDTLVIRIGLCVALLLSIPIMAKPAFDVLDEVFSSFRSSNETSDDQEVRKHLKSEEQVEEGHDIAFALSPSPPPSIVTTSMGQYWLINFWRMIILLFAALAAVFIPHFGEFVAVIGGSGCTTLAFTLPALFHWKLLRNSSDTTYTRWHLIIDWVIIIVGLLLSVLTTASAIRELVQSME